VFNAATHHLASWVNGGSAPPSQPLFDFAGEPPAIVRDEYGNAMDRINLPQMEVPVAKISATP
jgi:hypothetical protein